MEFLELLFELVLNASDVGDILTAALRYWRTFLGLAAGVLAAFALSESTESRTWRILGAVHLPLAGLIGGVFWEPRSGRLR
jgi:hypothetical protein